MTRKLYWDDPYQREFDGRVVALDGERVILDQTVFHPRGGGLVGDMGEIGGVRVVETAKGEGDSIIHVLEKKPEFAVEETVHGRLDWERRHRIMRNHTATHVLSAVIYREKGSLVTGNQVEPERSRVDFNLAEFGREIAEEFCEKANQILAKRLPVKTYFMKREDALRIPAVVKLAGAMPPEVAVLRIVEIEGVDVQADGGPHVQNLEEVGRIQLLKTDNKGKENRRLYFALA